LGGSLFRELDGFIGEIDADCFDPALARRREQCAGAAADVEQTRPGLGVQKVEENRIRRGGTHTLQSFRGVMSVIPAFDVFGTRHVRTIIR